MNPKTPPVRAIAVLALAVTTAGVVIAQSAQADYTSPYRWVDAVKDPALTPDFRESPKRPEDYRLWSTLPYEQWTNFRRIEELRSIWGPVYRHFEAPAGVFDKGEEWARLRILAAAAQVRGTVPYAHHHMHVWDVPDTQQWRDAKYTPGKGFDCSDFTHWAYSYGLGIELHTGIGEQAQGERVPIHLRDGATAQITAQNLFNVHRGYSKTYADLVSNLKPGDLMFIRGNAALDDKITHVIIWVGDMAKDSNGKDRNLIMDSHGGEVVDSNGVKIPSGPQIRPFKEDSWYFHSFDHVLRFVPLKRGDG